MAITVEFYLFAKKKNSTLRPSGDSHSYQCVLKDGCGVINPVLLLDLKDETLSPARLNYAYIANFGRYYYVREWNYDRGLWTASLTVDPLASWKESIGAESYYCTRSYIPGRLRSVAEQNIADGLYPCTSASNAKMVVGTSPWAKSLDDGCYIVSTMSSDSSGIGGMSTYVLNASQFGALKSFMFSSPAYLGIDDSELSEGLQKMSYNPGDYILSAMWLPVKATAGQATTVKFGWWDSGVSANLITAKGVVSSTVDFTIDRHPQAGNEYKYLNGAPYTKYQLYAPPFGLIELSPSDYIVADEQTSPNKFSCIVDIDVISGDGTMSIVYNTIVKSVHTAHCAVDINLGSIVVNASSILQGDTFGNLLNAGLGAVSSLFSGGSSTDILQSGFAALSSHTLGAKGGGLSAFTARSWILTESFAQMMEPEPEEFGYPTCGMEKPEEGAFYRMANPHVKIAGTEGEINQIVAEMEAGFFYE